MQSFAGLHDDRLLLLGKLLHALQALRVGITRRQMSKQLGVRGGLGWQFGVSRALAAAVFEVERVDARGWRRFLPLVLNKTIRLHRICKVAG